MHNRTVSSPVARILSRSFSVGLLLFGVIQPMVATAQSSSSSTALPDAPSTILGKSIPHEEPQNEKWNAYGQLTYIPEYSIGDFNVPYSGINTFQPGYQKAFSFSNTIFIGVRLNENTEVYFNSEVTEGHGINKNVGVIGFPNQENFRLGDGSGLIWNYARAYVVETIPLGGKKEHIDSASNQLSGEKSIKRITVIVGKFSLTDFFDKNDFSHDARSQFMNWVLVDNGAIDYMSDTHGYTFGTMTELNHEHWAVRAAVVTVPNNANGPNFDWKLGRAHGENAEFEGRYKLFGKAGVVRAWGFTNQTQAADYSTLIQKIEANPGLIYDSLTAPRDGKAYTSKYGLGLNAQQQITAQVGCFARAGWNNGKTETWAFTEADRSGSTGCLSQGEKWKRSKDQAGAAFFVSGLSSEHRAFLNAGGYGFIIGDGQLKNYAPEMGYEAFYTVHMIHDAMLTADFQRFENPAANADHPAINIYSIRLHKDFNFRKMTKKDYIP